MNFAAALFGQIISFLIANPDKIVDVLKTIKNFLTNPAAHAALADLQATHANLDADAKAKINAILGVPTA